MLYKSLRTHNRIMFLLATVAITAIALTACGGSDDEPAAAPQPTATSPPVATATPERPAPIPPEDLVATEIKYEPGSDEALMLAQLEKQVRAVNDENFALFVQTCAPSDRKQLTDNQVADAFSETWGGEGKQKPHGYNVKNIEMKMLREPFAQMEFDLFYYDEFDGSLFWTWEKVDDNWYLEVWPCK